MPTRGQQRGPPLPPLPHPLRPLPRLLGLPPLLRPHPWRVLPHLLALRALLLVPSQLLALPPLPVPPQLLALPLLLLTLLLGQALPLLLLAGWGQLPPRQPRPAQLAHAGCERERQLPPQAQPLLVP